MADLTEEQLDFVTSGAAAAMVTVGEDGYAKPVRVGVTIMDGQLCSTGTEGRRRTDRLRTDPHCTLYFADDQFRYLAVETRTSIVDGEAGIEESMRLVRQMQGTPEGPVSWFGETLEPDAFRQRMVDEERIVFRFEVVRAHGLLGMP